jgi:adenine-specific DNA methylase
MGIRGVDLYISTFGPTLEVFSGYSKVLSITGREISPEEALDAARRVVNERTIRLLIPQGGLGIDPQTKFYILAMHFYRARRFPFDEARKLAISTETDVDLLRKETHLLGKKGADVLVLSAIEREHSGYISSAKPTARPMINAIHLAELAFQRGGVQAYNNLVRSLKLDFNPDYPSALKALYEALPDVDEEKRSLAPLVMSQPETRPEGTRMTDYQ